jgi:putative inorganic carbon (hco3(-)) transporter
VETFAYSYYSFRPIEHNLVSEWDFLYNKAHNEYLNYLATTGILGIGTYLLVILVFLYVSFKKILFKQKSVETLLNLGLISGYISYLVQDFFGFSVVVIATLFYLIPAMFFVLEDEVYSNNKLTYYLSKLSRIILKRPIYLKSLNIVCWAICILILFKLFSFWSADTFYKKGLEQSEGGNPGKAYNYLRQALFLNSSEPLYKSELTYAAAAAAVALETQDATKSAELKTEATNETEQLLKDHPKNVSFFRTAIRTYYQLSGLDPQYNEKTIEIIDRTIMLSPTDPKLYYNKALILGSQEKIKEGIESLLKTVELKPNYKEAFFTLGLFYEEVKDYEKAQEYMEKTLKFDPTDQEIIKKIEELKQKKS